VKKGSVSQLGEGRSGDPLGAEKISRQLCDGAGAAYSGRREPEPAGCIEPVRRDPVRVTRQRVRLITMAWGERYIRELLAITLPAILAPNNLPALAASLDCELVILTEEAWCKRLQSLPVFARLAQFCTIDLRPIDDLISTPDSYGMALTYALFRGFADLGPAMVDIPLIFFNADFVLADGSLRTVGEKILAGERLILAPSYCVVAESVTPWLVSKQDQMSGSIAIPSRELAATALRNRHNTIRGKTVNQQLFSVEWMDQFYWLVDEQTMLAHQMPFAVVSMRPERVVAEMRTFWDYGIISEACPNTPRCVLADSDDFLMIELRAADTARGQLSLGWPEPEQIAEKAASFVTKDPIELARYTLVLHSGDLPSQIDDAKAQLDAFVDRVLAALPTEPTPWINHPIWAYHYPAFHRAREAFLERRAQAGATGGEDLASMLELAAVTDVPAIIINPTGRGLQATARRLYYKHFGKAPWLRPLHPRWADVQPALNILKSLPEARILVVTSLTLSERLFGNLKARHVDASGLGTSSELEMLPADNGGDQAGRLRLEADEELEAELTLPGAAAPHRVKLRSLELVWGRDRDRVTPEPVSAPSAPIETFDLCILEVNSNDMLKLGGLVAKLMRWMEPGGKILVFHLATNWVTTSQHLISEDALRLDLPCRIHFVGSERSVKAISAYNEGVAGLRTRRPIPAIRGLSRLTTACIASLRSRKSEYVSSRRAPAALTSLTLEIDISRTTGGIARDSGSAPATA